MLIRLKALLLLLVLILTVFIIGCSNEEEAEAEPTPEETFLEYAAYWEEGKYELMYELLSATAKEKITKEEFVERNNNIYSGIRATDLTVSLVVEEPQEEIESEEKEEEPEGEKEITYDKSMQTLAGEVFFRSAVRLQLEIEETETEVQKNLAT
jgi:penicillin-binding protein 3